MATHYFWSGQKHWSTFVAVTLSYALWAKWKSCSALYHTKSGAEEFRCCMKRIFSIEDDAQLIRTSPPLLDTSKSKSKPTSKALRELLLNYVQKYKCTRIWNVPYDLYSWPKLYKYTFAWTCHNNVEIKNRIPFGVRPPLAHWVGQNVDEYTPPRSSANDAQHWPASSYIALGSSNMQNLYCLIVRDDWQSIQSFFSFTETN